MVSFAFASSVPASKGALILTVTEGAALGPEGAKLDKALGGALQRAMTSAGFKGDAKKTLTILAPAATGWSRVVLLGLGNAAKLTESAWQQAGGNALAALDGARDDAATLVLDQPKGLRVKPADAAAWMAAGAGLRAYRFDHYRTKLKPEQKPALKSLTVIVKDAAAAKKAFAPLATLGEAVAFARDLVTEPGNVIYPDTLAERCRTLAKLGVKVTVLDEKKMKALGMGSLLGVAQGSVKPPRLVAMEWLGAPRAKDKRPLALVGKGVTFDSGGLSLKPPEGMESMKYDMAGSAAVIGTMMALASRKARANVVGVVGLVENMPDGDAQRPGDVVTSMSGQTIEVLNTDAEGRLVLADALWYAQTTYKPRQVVDLATLTGAITIALGNEYAGLFSNDDTLSRALTRAGDETDEPLWRFPLGEAYDRMMDSPIADMKNISGARGAGSITAAQFLQRFIKDGVAWAHLDIAGKAWAHADKPLTPKGATAFGVRLLNRFVADAWEG